MYEPMCSRCAVNRLMSASPTINDFLNRQLDDDKCSRSTVAAHKHPLLKFDFTPLIYSRSHLLAKIRNIDEQVTHISQFVCVCVCV